GNKSALISIGFLIFIVVISTFAFVIPIDPDVTNTSNILQSPSLTHLFGTDELGRDYFVRTVYGGRVSLTVGVLAMIISTSIGVAFGTISGYFGGKIDSILMRFVDLISSIPWMILVTVISIFLKPGLQAIIIVIGLFSWMETARLVRAETLSIK
ncbi:ABC transporter permease subunit, partial [Clostridium perfringens]